MSIDIQNKLPFIKMLNFHLKNVLIFEKSMESYNCDINNNKLLFFLFI